ncbi:protein of unknown function DUF964 [Gemmatirosa kalamazoonensis]|jgi:cell fate (sporulation/competence/biofilm development) regulator YlbF (YheA/YmcA/DUF963 family)|uniref:YlbF family regulator n=1 Tax=Gemmatirosa kalamazoonensis TaxID=861299 RepID=W0RJG1_9BACT|nr:YlbF family regulator [Gemmatirosa kalamazoonensis]AHG90475.1 protein of unknown function DUF964 [Gemmatirosa kalamazoonensis]
MLQDKATELGRLIGQSDEYRAVKRTSDALGEDREAVTLIREMERLRSEAQAMIERGQNPTPEMEQQLDDLLSKVQVNATYQRAIAAQDNFDKLMLRVNEWISEGIRKGAASSIITLG